MQREFIQRGELYGHKDGGLITVRYGSHKPYPDSDTVLHTSEENLPQLIALLKALQEAK